MNPESTFPAGVPIPRIDSFEVLEPDGPELTAEEANWPVAAVPARIDSFEVVGAPEPKLRDEVVIRVGVPGDASPDEAAAVVQQLRAAVEQVNATTGGRFPIRFDTPTARPA